MINKAILRRTANSSYLMKEFLLNYSELVVNANGPEEYVGDPRKRRFDALIVGKEICDLTTKEQVIEPALF